MNVLALEPYYGGSHKAFLDGWSAHSRHTWTILDLRPRKWKWRMRHAAVTLSDRIAQLLPQGHRWDALFCSDMLNLAEFLGLAPEPVRRLPTVVYFHENQLTYPFRHQTERDFHFGFTNMTTALAADAVWFNTAFHRDEFLDALRGVLKRMPDYQPLDVVDRIRAKSAVHPPGIGEFPPRGPRRPGSLRILWAARWEHDKNPADFFAALDLLKARGVEFRVSVVGEQFRDSPPIFDQAHETFHAEIDRWGYQPARADYVAALADADVVVSTAVHEFFGISIVEAMAAGCYPLVPQRLAYPELLRLDQAPQAAEFFYDGSVAALAHRLAELAERVDRDELWAGGPTRGVTLAERYAWQRLAPGMDAALETLRSQGTIS